MSNAQILFKTALWAAFVPLFLWSLWHKKLAPYKGKRAWLVFFLICAAGSLWGADTETFVDQEFGGYPVVIFLKAICILLTFALYYRILQEGLFNDVDFHTGRFHRLLDRLGPISIGMMVGGFVVSSLWRGLVLQPELRR